MATLNVLTINSGSSSLKACFLSENGGRRDFRYEHLDRPEEAYVALLDDLGDLHPTVVGHRVVHGGDAGEEARLIDSDERHRLERLIPLAPLHMPGHLQGIDLAQKHFNVPQIACFDTAFHSHLPPLATRLPIPNHFGLRKYGFHGLNYRHVATQLPHRIGAAAHGRVVVAHLGNGASLCLLNNLLSVDTTMGFSPAGGIVMGTRSGDLDPGVMLSLAQQMNAQDLTHLVYHEMGLKALSEGEASDMKDLLASPSHQADFAVAYFCQRVTQAIGAFAAQAGGLDALVFTGGIGEHAAEIRKKICAPLAFLGFILDPVTNNRHAKHLSTASSHPILIIAADEESVIATLCRTLLTCRP